MPLAPPPVLRTSCYVHVITDIFFIQLIFADFGKLIAINWKQKRQGHSADPALYCLQEEVA